MLLSLESTQICIHLVQKMLFSLDGFGLLHDDAISHLSTLVHLDAPLMGVIVGIFFCFLYCICIANLGNLRKKELP
jgi:hypothetical protein